MPFPILAWVVRNGRRSAPRRRGSVILNQVPVTSIKSRFDLPQLSQVAHPTSDIQKRLRALLPRKERVGQKARDDLNMSLEGHRRAPGNSVLFLAIFDERADVVRLGEVCFHGQDTVRTLVVNPTHCSSEDSTLLEYSRRRLRTSSDITPHICGVTHEVVKR